MVNFNDYWSLIEYQYRNGIISWSEYMEEKKFILEEERKQKEASENKKKEEIKNN